MVTGGLLRNGVKNEPWSLIMSKTIKQQWWEYHKKNPHVWDLFVTFTFQMINRGHQHYSSKAVFERIRWHTDIETKGDPFKICNNYTAYYARYFHVMYPEHEGFFRSRELRSQFGQNEKVEK